MRASTIARVAAVLALQLSSLPRAARADMMSDEQSACRGMKEGDPCDFTLRNAFPGYRGVCEASQGGGWRKRLSCNLPSFDLTPAQRACFKYGADGESCTRPSGAEGVCRFVEKRAAPAPGGVGTVDLPIFECRHVEPDHRFENRAGLALAAAATAAIAVLVAVLRRRARRGPPVEPAP